MLTWMGYFFSLGLPGAISGDLVKGYYVIRANRARSKTEILLTLLIDRFFGLSGLILLAFVALLFNVDFLSGRPEIGALAFVIAGLFLGTVLFYLLVFLEFDEGRDPFIRVISKLPAKTFLDKLYKALKMYRHEKRTLFFALALSTLDQASNLYIFYRITGLIEISNISAQMLLTVVPLGLITTVIPVAPVGIGVGHAAFDSLYRMIGYSSGADVFNLFIALEVMCFVLGGILFLSYSDNGQAKPNIERSEL